MATLDKNTVPTDFTLALACVDALPVLLFGGSGLLLARLFGSGWFLAGALLCFWAGFAKVLWKFLVVLAHKNIWWMFMQMRIAMPAGFGLMLLSLAIDHAKVDFAAMGAAVCSQPSGTLFLLGIGGMVAMGVLAAKLDSGSVKANWAEQLVNTFAQGCIFLGLLFLL